eukprot:PhM_4_TR16806/c2_g1_i1/m.52001
MLGGTESWRREDESIGYGIRLVLCSAHLCNTSEYLATRSICAAVRNVLILASRIMRFGTPQHRRHMFVFAMPSIMRLAWYNEFIDTRGNAQMMINCLLAVEMGSRLSVSCVLPAVAHVLSRATRSVASSA